MSYQEVRVTIAERFGWTFDEIDDLSFEQIYSLWSERKEHDGIPVHSPEEVFEIHANWRQYVGI